MTAEGILGSYVLAFACFFGWELLLNLLQMRALRSEVRLAPEIQNAFSADVISKSIEYSSAKTKLALFAHCYSGLILLVVIFSGLLVVIQELIAGFFPDSFYIAGILYILAVGFFFQIVDWPLQLYSTFVVEERFGFNRQSLRQWLKDLLQGMVLGLLIFSPLLLIILWFVKIFPEVWWIVSYLFVMCFQLLLLFIYPVWIAPLFNKFEKLPEGSLREKIFLLSEQLHFALSEIYLMDGSKRSSHGNAYFTGFGKNQRVVLYDTLINDLSEEQLVAVLAHEIGHKKSGHVLKQISLQAVVFFVIFAVLGLMFNSPSFYQAFGFVEKSPAVALVLFSFLSSPFLYFITPISSILQRRFEYQADAYARKAMGTATPLTEALIRLYQKNLGNLKPHPWYSFFHYSHPTLNERFAKLNEEKSDML